MDSTRLTSAAVILLATLIGSAIGSAVGTASAAEAPSAAQALGLTPIQALVDYSIPTKEEIPQCTIRPEKENNTTSWVVRNRQGEVLRRFADTNADNVVDQWCYFQGGLEVYRDIDSNYNGKADEYRWFNTAGTRWGTDKNEDGRIDSWRVISPQEVSEQVLFALKTRDAARFQLVLLTTDELNGLGFGKARADGIAETVKAAPAAFSKLLAEQKAVTPQSRYVDFGSARPATIPLGTGGSTKDVVICDNASALIQTDNNHDQISLGTLVNVGDTWKLVDAPTIGANQQVGGFLIAAMQQPGGAAGGDAPTEEMQKLMAELQQLDKAAETLPPEQIGANIEQRVAALQKLAATAPEKDRDQWYRQLIDVLSGGIQQGHYPDGVAKLEELQKTLTDAKADEDLISHAMFQRMWAQYVGQHDPVSDAAQVQQKWLADLQAFVAKYPKSTDTAEALFQLGMYQEFLGKTDEAVKWYQQLVADFPSANPASKAKGALWRLSSLGKPMALKGADLQGGGALDLASPQYRGKVVLVHYWATIGDRWKDDMVLLRDFYAKKAGKDKDFDIIGVCLDDDPTNAKTYLSQAKLPWKQIYEKGGLDSRLANEAGILTMPLMILVDQKGSVANPNMHVEELDSELTRLQKPAATGAANALRTTPTSR